MKRSLLYLLVVVVFAGWIGTLISRDAGYVLVSYDGATLQTGLWVMLGLLFTLAVGIFYTLRFLRLLGGANQKLKRWGDDKKRNKSQELTSKGLLFLQEGKYERAEKFLISGASESIYPSYNFIAAAKAMDKLNQPEKRESYLRQALESNTQATQAISLASAEMACEREDWHACLSSLKKSDKNKLSIALKKRALIGLEDWDALAKLMPQVEKIEKGEKTQSLEKNIVIQQLSRQGIKDEERVKIFKKASSLVRSDEDVLKILGASLQNEKEAESILRSALKQNWSSSLVETYASLGSDTLKRRLKTAEKWLALHEDDSSLQFCLASLQEQSGDRDKAKLLYERSIELGKNEAASRNLANLLAFDGDFEKSNEYFRLSDQVKEEGKA